MSQQNDALGLSFEAAAAIAQYALVKKTTVAGQVAANTTTVRPIGVAQNEAFAAGDAVTVRPLTAPTCKMIAGAAIAMGAEVGTDTVAGKVKTAATTQQVVGIALEAAAADGDIIEVATQGVYLKV